MEMSICLLNLSHVSMILCISFLPFFFLVSLSEGWYKLDCRARVKTDLLSLHIALTTFSSCFFNFASQLLVCNYHPFLEGKTNPKIKGNVKVVLPLCRDSGTIFSIMSRYLSKRSVKQNKKSNPNPKTQKKQQTNCLLAWILKGLDQKAYGLSVTT